MYIVQSIFKYDKENDIMLGYIRPENECIALFLSWDEALAFCKDYLTNGFGIESDSLCVGVDAKCPDIHYIFEDKDRNTHDKIVIWTAIIERDFGG